MSQIQEVKEASDIVDVIGSRISIQRSGTYFRGLCPFHGEKSPSFFVDERLQRYKCFGCGESGDAFTFLEKYEGMSFAEALQHLADKANITLESYKKSSDDELQEQLLEVLDLAKEYYHYLLTEHKTGEVAREYLKNRHVNNESIKLFQLGYSLPGWDGLMTFLHKKKKYSLDLLEQAGLILKGKNGRYYDRFRGRVMFPLRDSRGRVVGFSGRVLEGTAKDAKYINSPETLLYHKSKMLFGFSELFQHIRKAGSVIVVEGEFDVVTSQQAHVNNIVAIKGSALTEDHAKLLARVSDTVLLALDSDEAGVKATKKSIDVLKSTKVELRVLQVPEGKDPDELIRKDPKLWRETVKHSVTAYDFLISAAFIQFDATTPSGKRKIMEELAPVLSSVSHAVELEHYIKSVSEKLGVQQQTVKDDIQSYKKHKKLPEEKKEKTEAQKIEAKKLSPKEKQEQYCVYLLFSGDERRLVDRAQELAEFNFETAGLNQIIRSLASQEGTVTVKTFSMHLPEDLKQTIFDLMAEYRSFSSATSDGSDEEWKTALAKLQKLSITERINQITYKLALLDDKPDKTEAEEEKQNQLLKEIVLLRKNI
ncbi:MAG: DNA primase [Candidatus Pacebacteria bacterium]|nr:DNA primase [Candidatus Paceibacterota bacterium]PIR63949.1 MAG: DNA primase [Candidatus Pacebacteria bacterium CG10_big_fil_rev_8_21_14_0_10_40_26]PIZ78648.1 MAG: DNA primase [Candidatus Pacebacteria bacterium CG_4_10_14_0_2_um_filter_40_20]PJA68500.1 MAG: DNA primase [Candidatus Pacebacteria bacterium CG_4_9_14_3_um_filter_40_12]PJC41871.1 MAG: DNA primase [Candidatus Pacebacteria bacterium CG_4_9_14_0_2_um_filter_40_15]